MKTILLDDFRDFSFADVYRIIMGCNETSFEVQLARNNVAGKDESYDIIVDYYKAAFIGDKLAGTSRIFNYWTPSVFTNEPFTFHVTTRDREAFADALYFIIDSNFNDEYGTRYYMFEEDALAHFMTAFNDEEVSCCWGLLKVASDYINVFDEESCAL